MNSEICQKKKNSTTIWAESKQAFIKILNTEEDAICSEPLPEYFPAVWPETRPHRASIDKVHRPLYFSIRLCSHFQELQVSFGSNNITASFTSL